MKKSLIISLCIIILVGVGIWFYARNNTTSNQPVSEDHVKTFDAKNASFTIEKTPVTLVDGVSSVHSASMPEATITTRYFGNEAIGDLNGDGKDDTAFLVTQDGGGSGLFYYVVVALQTDAGYKTTNAVFIGDRIAPQSTEIHADSMQLNVNYADRNQGEPMSTQPSAGKVLLLKVTPEGILEGLMK